MFFLFPIFSLIFNIPIILVKDGLACAEIVIGDNPDITIRHAADELRHWVKEISGAELYKVE